MRHMFRRLLRLILLLLPGYVIAAVWIVWWLSPARPLKEWLIPGAFGQNHSSRINTSCTHAIAESTTNPLHPSVQIANPDIHFNMGHVEAANWRIDLGSGQVYPDSKGDRGLFLSPDLRYDADYEDDHWTIIDKNANQPWLTIPIPSGNRIEGLTRWFSYQPNGQLLALSHGHVAEIEVWSIANRRLAFRIQDAYYPWIFSPDGKLLAVTAADKCSVHVHDMETGEVVASSPPSELRVWSLAFSPREELLILHSYPNVERSLRIDVWRPRQQTSGGSFSIQFDRTPARAFQHGINFSADGRLVFFSWATRGYLHDLDAQPPQCLDNIVGAKSADLVVAPLDGGVSLLDRANHVWTIRDVAGGNVRTSRNYQIDTICASPQVSPNNHFIAIGERGLDRFDKSIKDFLERHFDWRIYPDRDIRLCVLDAKTGRQTTEVASWEVNRWTPDGNHFWTSDTTYSPTGDLLGVTFRLWSVYAAPPPWWLWSLTAIGVVWYSHRIWRWRRVVPSGASERRGQTTDQHQHPPTAHRQPRTNIREPPTEPCTFAS
jgi:WD40 repeat protein